MFVVRTAGHVLDSAVLGSIEYAVTVLNVPLIVVLGHDSCGAVKATLAALDDGEVPGGYVLDIVERITPVDPARPERRPDAGRRIRGTPRHGDRQAARQSVQGGVGRGGIREAGHRGCDLPLGRRTGRSFANTWETSAQADPRHAGRGQTARCELALP